MKSAATTTLKLCLKSITELTRTKTNESKEHKRIYTYVYIRGVYTRMIWNFTQQ